MQNITLWFTKKIYPITAFGTLIFGLGTAFAYAQQQQNGAPNPVQNVQQLQDVLCTFIVYFFWIVITISVIMILYAAFTYVTARDDQEKTSRARRTITYAALGIAVALLAVGFPNIVGSLFPNLNTSLNLQCTIFGG